MIRKKPSLGACHSLLWAVFGFFVWGGLSVSLVRAQGELEGAGLTREQERELAYADALLDAGLPDYSATILGRLNLPAQIMDIRRIRSHTARGQFDEARRIVAANPGTSQAAMTLKLTLADGFYAWGRYDEAQKLYEEFFRAFPDGPEEDLKPFYLSSAYKYAQMMILTGNRTAAAEAYRMALRSRPERHIARQLQSELAELLLLMARDAAGDERRKLMQETEKLADEILWVQDLWFGRAIVLLAHMRVMDGNIDGAMQLVEDYTPQLRTIDQALREQSDELGEDLTKLSPMAQCRYLIGEIMHDRAIEILAEGGDRQAALELLIGRRTERGQQGAGAVQHFLNVFVRYPNTSWAPHAGNRFRQVEELLDREFGRQVVARITPEQWREVELAQFREARALFNQSRFDEAADSYLRVLALFPEQETSIPAFGELAASLIENEEVILADAVVRHLAERFNKNQELSTEAGNQVIRVANRFMERNLPEKQRETYDVFFLYFPRHPRALLELQRFAREALRNEAYELALRYLEQIVENHPGRSAYFEALGNIARVHAELGAQADQGRTLTRLIREMEEANVRSQLRISALYQLASLLREMGPRFADQAQARYRTLRELLEGDQADAFAANPEERETNQKLLQASLFYSAVLDAMRTTVPEPVQAAFNRRAGREVAPEAILNNHYRAGAIRQFLGLVDRFPQSAFAPAALSQAGTLSTILQRAEDAAQALQRLQREYPDSPEAANAVFMIGRNLLEMGRRDQAVEYFKEMFAGGGDYPPGQILTAGQELLAEGEYQMALEAFDRVIASSQERRLLEPARVGKGRALLGLERYRDAAAHLDRVIEDFPQSGLTIEISRTASEANAVLASRTENAGERFDLFNKAVRLMNRARQFAQDEGTRTELDLAVAALLVRRAEAEARFGTAARVAEFRNEALAAYQTVIMFRDASNPAVAPHVQTAYNRAMPLMMEMERWEDVQHDAQAYLDKFPNGRYVLAMRQALTQARLRGAD